MYFIALLLLLLTSCERVVEVEVEKCQCEHKVPASTVVVYIVPEHIYIRPEGSETMKKWSILPCWAVGGKGNGSDLVGVIKGGIWKCDLNYFNYVRAVDVSNYGLYTDIQSDYIIDKNNHIVEKGNSVSVNMRVFDMPEHVEYVKCPCRGQTRDYGLDITDVTEIPMTIKLVDRPKCNGRKR